MNEKLENPAKATTYLSDRWTHPEGLGRPVGSFGKGDVSGWASGTTRFVRPKLDFKTIQHARPVTNLAEVERFANRTQSPQEHKPGVVLPFESPVPKQDMDMTKTMKIQKNFWKLLGCSDMDVRPFAK